MKRLAAVLAVVLTSAMAPAFGQAYVAGYGGQSDYDIDCAGTTSCDVKDTGFKIAGGYMFTPNFGVEGFYTNLGKANATLNDPFLGSLRAEIKATAFGLYGVGAVPIGDFSLFGKLGLASVEMKVSAAAGIGSASDKETTTSFAWAVGAGYNFNRNLALEVEYSRTRGKYEGEEADIDLLAAGVKFTF
jgi:OmpA-OmpF porin, OOP family